MWLIQNVCIPSNIACCRLFRLTAAIDGEAMKIQPSMFGWYNISSQGKINLHDSYILENSDNSIMYHEKHGWRVRIPWKWQWIFLDLCSMIIHCLILIHCKTIYNLNRHTLALQKTRIYRQIKYDWNVKKDALKIAFKTTKTANFTIAIQQMAESFL